MARLIEHSGVVDRVEGDTVRVKITSRSACGACSARQACGLAEAQEKIVAVRTHRAAEFAAGDEVMVGVRSNAGARAVLLAYVGALVVLLAALAAAKLLGGSDGQAVVAALGGVSLYYAALWCFRSRIEHTIHFTITKS
ncbi:SoxR reducing system RseC family protein [uncultured Alistipes sp.]|uniref:SoxR reducing system RseC family protein n=1 Tax=uncultured Alistipes sp. TaxID=538949 RepID=UPI00260F38A0|nr:SoxR reducing system RseC family protein [uncultured Alistipes sp.]